MSEEQAERILKALEQKPRIINATTILGTLIITLLILIFDSLGSLNEKIPVIQTDIRENKTSIGFLKEFHSTP